MKEMSIYYTVIQDMLRQFICAPNHACSQKQGIYLLITSSVNITIVSLSQTGDVITRTLVPQHISTELCIPIVYRPIVYSTASVYLKSGSLLMMCSVSLIDTFF